jgi:hypothetical protein
MCPCLGEFLALTIMTGPQFDCFFRMVRIGNRQLFRPTARSRQLEAVQKDDRQDRGSEKSLFARN